MKKICFTVFAAIFLLISCKTATKKGENGEEYKTAGQYNDYIADRQEEVLDMIKKFTVISQSEAGRANAYLTESAIKVEKIVTDVEGMPDWKGNTELRDKGVAMFKYYKKILSTSYKKVIDIKSDGQITPEEEKEQEAIMEELSEGAPIEAEFITAQKDFAKKTNMTLKGD